MVLDPVSIWHILITDLCTKVSTQKYCAWKCITFFFPRSSCLVFVIICREFVEILTCVCSCCNVTFLNLLQTRAEQSQGAYFLPEFALSPQGSFLEDTTGEQFLTYRYDDQVSMPYMKDIGYRQTKVCVTFWSHIRFVADRMIAHYTKWKLRHLIVELIDHQHLQKILLRCSGDESNHVLVMC